jgi:hypothetical protein
MLFIFEKLPNLKDSNRLPGVFFAGELISNANISVNILKFEIVSGHAFWYQDKLFDEKKVRQKSHYTFPLTLLSVNNYVLVLNYPKKLKCENSLSS